MHVERVDRSRRQFRHDPRGGCLCEGATVGDQVIACDGQDVPVLAGEPSRATLLSALCGHPGAARIRRAAARCIAAAIALLTARSLLPERSRLVATIIAFCAGMTATDALAQNVVAHVNSVFYGGEQPFVLGWACQPSRNSLDIKISADARNGPFLLTGRVDFESDAGVGNAYRDPEGKRPLKLPVPSSMFVKGRGRKVYAGALPPKKLLPLYPARKARCQHTHWFSRRPRSWATCQAKQRAGQPFGDAVRVTAFATGRNRSHGAHQFAEQIHQCRCRCEVRKSDRTN